MEKTEKLFFPYLDINLNYTNPQEAAKIGQPVVAQLVCRKEDKMYFKLNLQRTGVVSTPSAFSRLQHLQLFDFVTCAVSGVSICGNFIYLDLYDDLREFYDYTRRGQNFISSFIDSEIDPNLDIENLKTKYMN